MIRIYTRNTCDLKFSLCKINWGPQRHSSFSSITDLNRHSLRIQQSTNPVCSFEPVEYQWLPTTRRCFLDVKMSLNYSTAQNLTFDSKHCKDAYGRLTVGEIKRNCRAQHWKCLKSCSLSQTNCRSNRNVKSYCSCTQNTGGIPQPLDTDVHSVVTVKTSTLLWDSSGSDSAEVPTCTLVWQRWQRDSAMTALSVAATFTVMRTSLLH